MMYGKEKYELELPPWHWYEVPFVHRGIGHEVGPCKVVYRADWVTRGVE